MKKTNIFLKIVLTNMIIKFDYKKKIKKKLNFINEIQMYHYLINVNDDAINVINNNSKFIIKLKN